MEPEGFRMAWLSGSYARVVEGEERTEQIDWRLRKMLFSRRAALKGEPCLLLVLYCIVSPAASC